MKSRLRGAGDLEDRMGRLSSSLDATLQSGRAGKADVYTLLDELEGVKGKLAEIMSLVTGGGPA